VINIPVWSGGYILCFQVGFYGQTMAPKEIAGRYTDSLTILAGTGK
jgi:hypothetical protein